MVDTIFEAKQYLKGSNIVKENLYRICYLLSCHFMNEGIGKVEARKRIFEWAKKQGIWIKYDVNSIIMRAYESPSNTYIAPMVKINKQDVCNIKETFDGYKVRLVALALLCYAKAYANKKGEFHISCVALSAWLGINRKTLRGRYIKELVDFEYLTEISKPKTNSDWSEQFDKQGIKYKINCSLHNSGPYVLEDNDIHKLFSEAITSPR